MVYHALVVVVDVVGVVSCSIMSHNTRRRRDLEAQQFSDDSEDEARGDEDNKTANPEWLKKAIRQQQGGGSKVGIVNATCIVTIYCGGRERMVERRRGMPKWPELSVGLLGWERILMIVRIIYPKLKVDIIDIRSI